MKTGLLPTLIGLCVAALGAPAFAQDKSDLDQLQGLVRDVRAQLEAIRVQAGVKPEPAARKNGERRQAETAKPLKDAGMQALYKQLLALRSEAKSLLRSVRRKNRRDKAAAKKSKAPIVVMDDYDKALAMARKQGKRLLLNFTGLT